jgi:hypothetical protein
MKQTIIKDGVKDKLKFVFSFKTFFPKGKKSEYDKLPYAFNKNKLTNIVVVATPPQRYSSDYQLSFSCIKYESDSVQNLVKDLRGVVAVIKQRHFTDVSETYDEHEEGYDYGLDDLMEQ